MDIPRGEPEPLASLPTDAGVEPLMSIWQRTRYLDRGAEGGMTAIIAQRFCTVRERFARRYPDAGMDRAAAIRNDLSNMPAMSNFMMFIVKRLAPELDALARDLRRFDGDAAPSLCPTDQATFLQKAESCNGRGDVQYMLRDMCARLDQVAGWLDPPPPVERSVEPERQVDRAYLSDADRRDMAEREAAAKREGIMLAKDIFASWTPDVQFIARALDGISEAVSGAPLGLVAEISRAAQGQGGPLVSMYQSLTKLAAGADKLEQALVAFRAGDPNAPKLVPPQELINGWSEFVQRVNGTGDVFNRVRDLAACVARVGQWLTGYTSPASPATPEPEVIVPEPETSPTTDLPPPRVFRRRSRPVTAA